MPREDENIDKDIERIVGLRKKHPHVKAITLSTEVYQFFEDYYNEPEDFIQAWIAVLRNRDLNGIDLYFGNFAER